MPLTIGSMANANGTQIAGLMSLQGNKNPTGTAGFNLCGTITVPNGTLNTATTTFSFTTSTGSSGLAEPDTNYTITFGPAQAAGASAAGQNRILQYTKATSGFTVQLEATTTQAISLDWHLIRNQL
jgi:hypothetical protein